jgi:hypothetical protein
MKWDIKFQQMRFSSENVSHGKIPPYVQTIEQFWESFLNYCELLSMNIQYFSGTKEIIYQRK